MVRWASVPGTPTEVAGPGGSGPARFFHVVNWEPPATSLRRAVHKSPLLQHGQLCCDRLRKKSALARNLELSGVCNEVGGRSGDTN